MMFIIMSISYLNEKCGRCLMHLLVVMFFDLLYFWKLLSVTNNLLVCDVCLKFFSDEICSEFVFDKLQASR